MTAILSSRSCKKWMSVIGMFLILSPTGIVWYWGNLSVYVMSYVISYGDSSDVTGPWLLSCLEVGCSCGMFVSIWLSRILGKRITAICGIVMFAMGLVAAYFTIGEAYLAMSIIVGLATGTGLYVINGVIMSHTLYWSDNDFGFIHSIVQSGLPAGSIFTNQVITLYINPNNLSPDSHKGPLKYFSQNEILDRVPRVFLILMVILVTVCTVGMLMIREIGENCGGKKTKESEATDADVETLGKNETLVLKQNDTNRDECSGVSCNNMATSSNIYGAIDRNADFKIVRCDVTESETMQPKLEGSSCGSEPFPEIESSITETTLASSTGSNGASTNTAGATKSGFVNGQRDGYREDVNVDSTSRNTGKTRFVLHDLTPRQMIRSPYFYYYGINAAFGQATYVVLANYYKTYGQLYIHSDHFITNTSIAILIMITISRVLWGKLLDRYGLKTSFIIFFSCCGISSLSFYFSAMVGRWCYLINIVFMASCGASVFVILAYACLKTFGESHFLFNFGLIFFPTTFVVLGISQLIELLLGEVGWFALYASCSCWNLLSLIISIFALPNI